MLITELLMKIFPMTDDPKINFYLHLVTYVVYMMNTVYAFHIIGIRMHMF